VVMFRYWVGLSDAEYGHAGVSMCFINTNKQQICLLYAY